MQMKWKILLIRVISIPVLLLLPLFFSIPGCAIADENRGDSWPIFSMLGFGLGFVVASVLSVWTLFIRKDGFTFRAPILLTLAVALEIAALLIARKWAPKREPNQAVQRTSATPSSLT